MNESEVIREQMIVRMSVEASGFGHAERIREERWPKKIRVQRRKGPFKKNLEVKHSIYNETKELREKN